MQKPYFLEKALPHLVRKYMDSHVTVDLDLMTEYIIENEFQFRNKKFKAFRNSVNTAYQWNLYLIEEEKKALAKSNPVNDNATANEATPVTAASKAGKSEEVKVLATKKASLTPKSVSSKKAVASLDEEIESSILRKSRKSILRLQIPPKIFTFKELGGISHLFESLSSICYTMCDENWGALSLLLMGPERSGKSTIIRALAKSLSLEVYDVHVKKILSGGGPLSSQSKRMEEELTKADAALPAVILMHNLDQLFGHEESSVRRSEKLDVADVVISYMQGLARSPPRGRVLVVGETSRSELLSWELKETFTERLVITPPGVTERREMLEMVCREELKGRFELSADVDFAAVALKASGFVAGDLVKLVKEACNCAAKRAARTALSQLTSLADLEPLHPLISQGDRPKVVVSSQDFLQVVKLVTPSLKRFGFPAIPDTTWADIGGLAKAKEQLRQCILYPIIEPEMTRRFCDDQSTGVLLWGPPGCGKTLLAKAVANEAGINLLTVNGPELLSMYQGESERAVREVFSRAVSVAPCVIFFDEFDSLCPRRSKTGSESGSKSTIVNMLLTEMDGFLARPGIFLMAATNLPTLLDPAVLRPGRFDTKLYVGPPDQAGRLAVLNARTKNGTYPRLAADVDLARIAALPQCQHFTGADCRSIVDGAIKVALAEIRRNKSAACPLSDEPDQHDGDEQTGEPSQNGGSGHDGNLDQNEANGKKRSREDSEVECSIKKAKFDGVHETSPAQQSAPPQIGTDDSMYMLYDRHFQEALKSINPSVSEKERLQYEEQKLKF